MPPTIVREPKRKFSGCILAIVAAVIFLLFFIKACIFGFMPNYSDGSRAGVVTKLSRKGVALKSWEGEMVLGGVRTNTSSTGDSMAVANIFDFNCEPSVAEEVEKAMLAGERVELVYHQWRLGPCWIDDDHVVVAVRHNQPTATPAPQ